MLTRFKLARLNAGLTQFGLAKATGIGTCRLSLLERGLVEFRDRELQAVAKAVGCAPVDLIESPTQSEAVAGGEVATVGA